MLQIYNSLTRAKEEFRPIEPPVIKSMSRIKTGTESK